MPQTDFLNITNIQQSTIMKKVFIAVKINNLV